MSDSKRELKILLDRAEVIKERYQQVNLDNEFNVFSILRKEHDEVGLHSRFIYELLSPKGVHYLEDDFLKLFLDHIGVEYDENDLINYKVEREYRVNWGQNNDRYNNLDILISYDDKAYILENKIYEEERIEQLDCYYQAIKNKFINRKVILLTLFDHQLEESKIDVLPREDFIQITYEKNIVEWLSACIKETSQKPLLRETLVMYKNLVLKLTGQSYSEGMVREMKDLIIKDRGNLENAVLIAEGLSKARIEIQEKFWSELEDILKEEYGLEAKNLEGRVSNNAIKDYDKYGSSKEIGLPYLLIDEEGYKIVFWVTGNKSYGIAFSLSLYDDSNKLLSDKKIIPEIWAQVSDIANKLEGYFEPVGCPANKWALNNLKFTFEKNNDEFKLVDDSFRKEFITEIAQELHKDIDAFIKAYKKET